MKEVMHFRTEKERLAYLKGNFEEIVPQKASKPKKKAKKAKKEETGDEVQAE